MYLSKREKTLFWLTIILGLIFLSTNYIFKPLRESFHQTKGEIASYEISLVRSRRLLSQKEAILSEYRNYSSHLKKVSSLEEEMSATLKEVEDLAKRSFLHLKVIRPQPEERIDSYVSLNILMEVEGDLSSMVKFIQKVNTSSEFLRIQSLKLKQIQKRWPLLEGHLLVRRLLEVRDDTTKQGKSY